MNSGPPGHGDAITSSTSGFATRALGGKFALKTKRLRHIWRKDRMTVKIYLQQMLLETARYIFGIIAMTASLCAAILK